jgi:hypothetical protein
MRGEVAMKRYVKSVLLSLCGTVLLSGTALAADYKQYPGLICDHYVGGSLGMYYGTVYNASLSPSGDMLVRCPLVRDNAYLSSAIVSVYDRHADKNVSCEFRYEYASGSGIYSQVSYGQSSGFGADPKNISLNGLTGGSHYYVFCWLPPVYGGQASHVINFWVVEPRTDYLAP